MTNINHQLIIVEMEICVGKKHFELGISWVYEWYSWSVANLHGEIEAFWVEQL